MSRNVGALGTVRILPMQFKRCGLPESIPCKGFLETPIDSGEKVAPSPPKAKFLAHTLAKYQIERNAHYILTIVMLRIDEW